MISGSLNEYDTYNPDCQRIRRSWNTMSDDERNLFISGLLALRDQDGDITKDELVAVAKEHDYLYASLVHRSSANLPWHHYLLWEVESRIRNLGGDYACFGMPYWDFTVEHGRESDPFILSTGIGGDGDPDDYYTVNEYSWDISLNEWWVPHNCLADDDDFPLCSLKRAVISGSHYTAPSAKTFGAVIIKHSNWRDFSREFQKIATVLDLFKGAGFFHKSHLHETTNSGTTVTSYDPMWWLFHSMEQLMQAMWVNCHNFDDIDPDDLHKYPHAYSPYCDDDMCSDGSFPDETVSFDIDDKFVYYGGLKDADWAFMSTEDVTIRKTYFVPRWNIIYELDSSDGVGFYEKSGLKDYCKYSLNDDWFITDDTSDDTTDDTNEDYVALNASISNNSLSMNQISMAVSSFIFLLIAVFVAYSKCKNSTNKDKTYANQRHYGSI